LLRLNPATIPLTLFEMNRNAHESSLRETEYGYRYRNTRY